jgi:hypothetical protein
MGKILDAVISLIVFVFFLYVAYRLGFTLSDVITYFEKFFGVMALTSGSRIKKKSEEKKLESLRSRIVHSILRVIPRNP